ncbi:MAG: hypothetical protein QM733_18310 [Ilumatobacteraceae bacterium]
MRELIARLRNQCLVARWIGEQAVGVVRRELAQAWEAGRVTSRHPAPSPEVVDDVDVDVDDVPLAEVVDLTDVLAAAAHVEQLDAGELPVAVTHVPAPPFDGYDTLPASHVVQRLRRMTPDELRHAAEYEALHRNRSTVLGMVDQLLEP